MKVIESINAASDALVALFKAAGLVNGLELNPDQLKAETGLIFWPGQIKSRAGSDKEQYLTYTPTESTGSIYADGVVKARDVVIRLELFSRSRSLVADAEKIEDALYSAGWSFEFIDFDYDAANKMYIYTFETKVRVIDDD